MHESIRPERQKEFWSDDDGVLVREPRSEPWELLDKEGAKRPAIESMINADMESFFSGMVRINLDLPEKLLVEQFTKFVREMKDHPLQGV
jgi:hypothetical protein